MILDKLQKKHRTDLKILNTNNIYTKIFWNASAEGQQTMVEGAGCTYMHIKMVLKWVGSV